MDQTLAGALTRLESLLARSRAAIVPVMHPGIDESQVTRLLSEVNLRPTAEVVTWYGWHDGAGGKGMPSEVIELVPGGEFRNLRYLCGEYLTNRRVASELAAIPGTSLDDAELHWPTHWFPLLRLPKGFLAVDLAGGGTTSPVHISWVDSDPEDQARVAWPSIGAFVEAVIDRFGTGVYLVDDDGIVQGPTIDYPSEHGRR